VVDQAKIALTLVQNWICTNEVIGLKNTEISKITMSRKPHFKSIPKKFYSENDNIFFVIEFRRNYENSL